MKFTIVVVNIGQEAAPLLSYMLQVTLRRAFQHCGMENHKCGSLRPWIMAIAADPEQTYSGAYDS